MNQNSQEVKKSCTGTVLFAGMFIFSIIGLAIGWLAWDLRTGVIIALSILALFFASSMITFLTIENPGAITASLPMILGLVYNVAPDVPGPFDDVIIQLVTGLLTFFMWKRRDDRFPTWALIPFAIIAVYPFVGEFIPGPFDELLVSVISVSIVIYKYRKNLAKDPERLDLIDNNFENSQSETFSDIADGIQYTSLNSNNQADQIIIHKDDKIS